MDPSNQAGEIKMIKEPRLTKEFTSSSLLDLKAQHPTGETNEPEETTATEQLTEISKTIEIEELKVNESSETEYVVDRQEESEESEQSGGSDESEQQFDEVDVSVKMKDGTELREIELKQSKEHNESMANLNEDEVIESIICVTPKGKETIKKILSVGASHLSSLERTVNIKSVPQEITIQKRFKDQISEVRKVVSLESMEDGDPMKINVTQESNTELINRENVPFDSQYPSTRFELSLASDQAEDDLEVQKGSGGLSSRHKFSRILNERYGATIDKLQAEIHKESARNKYLHKRVIFALRKVSKLEVGLGEPSSEHIEHVKKYKVYLNAYQNQEDQQDKQLAVIDQELMGFKKIYDKQLMERNTTFERLQELERETANGLINTKTGKKLTKEEIDRLLSRQKENHHKISQMRVKFIKLRNRVNEIKAQLQKLEFIDENFRISDYEALKVKSRFYVNHLEEREEELNKLRVVCQNSIQILAHFKEKAVASEADLSQLAYELQIVTLEIMQRREILNSMKQRRDRIRFATNNLINESNLLTERDLLADMERSGDELLERKAQLESLTAEIKVKKEQVRNIRKHIENITEEKKDQLPNTSGVAKRKITGKSERKMNVIRLPTINYGPYSKKL
ncbi:coiled-coil domain-containing protein 96 [Aethina tumida]|uniref:coiled-coil domain-containing protein 96 n=1 Tax=Aethina tumida TaxID=116153 RepID=UPI002147F8CF|nr:coiled-coil domain-containing protein 96 [Aethina tumida]